MRLPPFVTRNVGWKLVSIALATLVWLSLRSGVPGRLRHGGTVSLPRQEVHLLKSPGDTRQFRIEPAVVDIIVGGEAEVLERMQPEDLTVFVRMGKGTLPPSTPQPVQVYAPAGVTVLAINPPEVVISLAGTHPAGSAVQQDKP